jgi:5-methylcytosine-specific restriction endonuclease McrA
MLKPCRRCKKPTAELGALCSICKRSKYQERPGRHARGYDAAYDAGARDVRARARAGETLCVICGGPINDLSALTVEHITPLRHGGTSDRSNLGPAHAACNYGWRKGVSL